MQLPWNQKTFPQFFYLEFFEAKYESKALFFSEIVECKEWCYFNACVCVFTG